jgi:MFS family permease
MTAPRVRAPVRSTRALAGNRRLARVALGYALFILTEYAVWIAMLVYAFDRGGTAVAGWIAVAQLVPAAAVAPLAARAAARRSPVRLLTVGFVLQAAAMGATSLAVVADRPELAYGAAVVASAAVTTTRPAQASLVPSLVEDADQLTAANVLLGWIESIGIVAAGLLVGVLVGVSGTAAVFGVCAALAVVGAALVAGLRAPALRPLHEERPTRRARSGPGGVGPSGHGSWRSLGALLTAQAVVIGALDLLLVLLAVDVLHRPQAWAGYLNLAYGLGAVLSGGLAALLVGRRLGVPVLGSALLLGLALATLAAEPGLVGTLLVLAAVGACRCLLDVGARTLLQRTVPAEALASIFGLVEGLTMAGLAVGALLVPLLVGLGGSSLALLGVAAVLPLVAVAGGRSLLRLDDAPVPVVEIGLLRSLPLFAELPPPVIEGLARALRPVELQAGDVLIREGEPGDAFYAVARGELEVLRDEAPVRVCHRGGGVGEIALLRRVPRTATVRARTDAMVLALDREPFLAAVTGHRATLDRAGAVVDARLLADAARRRLSPAPPSLPAPAAEP